MEIFEKYHDVLTRAESIRRYGRVREIIGLVAQCEGLSVPLGAQCEIQTTDKAVLCEVIGFRGENSLLMAYESLEGVRLGDPVVCMTGANLIPVGDSLLGRVIDATGTPLDDGPPIIPEKMCSINQPPPHPLSRKRIAEPIGTGIRTIDGLLSCGKGQRVGLFSGSGVGKSVLMGMIARNTEADVCVIALVGERGREVREFVERDLGPEGLKRSIVVVETSERSALLRVKAPFTATTVAEHFRDQGKDVLLLMDSVTRQANAQREIGLSAGEPPATKGYPPSVFTRMPQLMERAGCGIKGSITGFYTVLVEGDDMNEPIADAARSILDGHVWLSRRLATEGHYPAIDVLESVSRLMTEVASEEQQKAGLRVRQAMATYREAEDLINVGAYVQGANPEIDLAVKVRPAVKGFLRQARNEGATFEETRQRLIDLVKGFDGESVPVST